LYSDDLAISRVARRVLERGYHIPEAVIWRRYKSGLENFFTLFLPKVDNWLFVNNSGNTYEIVAEGIASGITINNKDLWVELKQKYHG
jgi:predicted ABC-type ATPase